MLTDIRRAVLQGTKGRSWTSQPMDVQLEGRNLPVIDTGSRFQYGLQPVIVYTREEFQGL